ncbi:MAG TPA: metal ABC transporter permease [Halieaceae bacterium]|nr:metal ABC transporter permease [Halieaceae bacterium]
MRGTPLTDPPSGRLDFRVLGRLVPLLAGNWPRIGLALACLLAAKGALLAIPFLLKHLVDGLDGAEAPALAGRLLVGLVLAYGAARFANVFFGELRDTLFGRVTERAMRRIGLTAFRHVHSLELDYHLNRRTGGLARDIERGTTGISFLLRFFVFNIAPTLFEIVMVAGILLFNYGGTYAGVVVTSVVAYALFSFRATEWRTRFVRAVNEADSSSNTRAVDSLLNYETVKYFTNEGYEADRYDRSLAEWEQARRSNRLSLFALNAGQALIIALSQTAVIGLAAWQVSSGVLSIGDFVLINQFMLQLFMPLGFLGFVYREIKSSLANIENLFALLDREPAIRDAPAARSLAVGGGEVVFDAVSFHYPNGRPVLDAVSFRVPPGKKVALVGASGAGKSTLVKLLFRFYDPAAGAVRIDGQDLRSVTQESLREAIGIVPQDTVLFNDSLRENIRYGRPGASDDEVQAALARAHLADFVAELPEGLDTTVGERGLKLSGGEKQRVAIARVILKNPPILILDEATSSLDSLSEQAILGALKEVSHQRTTLVIAHRLSTVRDANSILVMDGGRIVESGSHHELLARDGHYARLWEQQHRTEDN